MADQEHRRRRGFRDHARRRLALNAVSHDTPPGTTGRYDMTDHKLGVGIIGLTPGLSWGAIAHVPALRALSSDLDIVGVANSSLESGKAAAEALGLPRAFASVEELAAAPEVNIVAITVKVPHHLPLARAAIAAGKHVYCEWPLGNGLVEAETMAAMVRDAGVVGVTGMQALGSIELGHVRKLVADGFVGRLLSVTLVAHAQPGGPTAYPMSTYLLDRDNGANLLTIPLGHSLAALQTIVGDIAELSAVVTTSRTEVTMAGTNEKLARTAPDQVVVAGKLCGGAPISIHYRGETTPGVGLLLEIVGEDGLIQVTGTSGHMQYHDLAIKAAKAGASTLETVDIMPEAYAGWPEEKRERNVARLYSRMVADIRTGSRTAPSFDDAVALHRLIAAIEQSSDSGKRVSLTTSNF
jgi:predicted dehydrogenase